jgi:hypothetical protein
MHARPHPSYPGRKLGRSWAEAGRGRAVGSGQRGPLQHEHRPSFRPSVLRRHAFLTRASWRAHPPRTACRPRPLLPWHPGPCRTELASIPRTSARARARRAGRHRRGSCRTGRPPRAARRPRRGSQPSSSVNPLPLPRRRATVRGSHAAARRRAARGARRPSRPCLSVTPSREDHRARRPPTRSFGTVAKEPSVPGRHRHRRRSMGLGSRPCRRS